MGFTISSHYCRGHLVQTKLLHGTTISACCMSKVAEVVSKDCAAKEEITTQKNGCCENKIQVVNIEDDFNDAPHSITLGSKAIATLSTAFILPIFFKEIPQISYSNYFPPPLTRELHVLHQAFLL